MMGGVGIQGPQEHLSFFKLNPGVEDCPAVFAKRAGNVLSTVSNGIYGASFRPASSDGYDWVFKVQFKSVEDLEVYYGLLEDLVQGANAEELVSQSMLVDLPGLRGSVKAGSGELVALFVKPSGVEDVEEIVQEGVEDVHPPGLVKVSVRPVHEAESLFSGYESMQPGFTHALMANFDSADNLAAFTASGAMQAALGKVIPAGVEPAPAVISYVF